MKTKLTVIIVLFFLCGIVYGLVTPPFEMPDESSHLTLVRYVGQKRELPPLVIGQRLDSATNLVHNISFNDPPLYYAPPLYYTIGAALTFWTDMDDLPNLLVPNPRWEMGWALTADTSLKDKNFYAHRFAEETWSRSGTVRATYTLRLVSLFLATMTVLVAYGVSSSLFPDREWMALSTAAIVAFIPQFIATSAAVTNDNLTNAIFSLFFLIVSYLMRHQASWRHWAGLGGLVGLGLLTKQSALLLLPLGLLAILWQQRLTWRPNRKAIVDGIAFASVAVVVGGWWYVRNAVLYNDPLGMGPHQTQIPLTSFGLKDILWAIDTYYGVFGWSLIRIEPQVYILVKLCILTVLVGICWSLRPGGRLWAQPKATQRVMLFLGIALIANAVSFVRWSIATGSILGRLLYPSIVPIAVLSVWGGAQWSRWRAARCVWGITIAMMIAFAVCVPWRYLRPAFASPRLAELPRTAQVVDVAFRNSLRLVGYTAPRDNPSPGQSFELTLYWLADGDVGQRCRVWVQLGPWNAYPPLDLIDTWLGGTLYPTDLWLEGDMVQQGVKLSVPNSVTEPRLYWIRVGIINEMGERVELEKNSLVPETGPWDPTVGQAAVIGPWRLSATTTLSPTYPAHYHFEPGVDLLGYDFALQPAEEAELLQTTLFWQASELLDTDYLIRAHLMDAEGQCVGEDQTPPQDGEYPTSWWLPQQVVATHYRFLVTEALSSTLQVQVKLVDPDTLLPLPAYDKAGQRLPAGFITLPLVTR